MKRKTITTFIFICLVIVSLLVADQFFNLGISKKSVSYISPIGTVFTNTGSGISKLFKNLTNLGELQKENNDLKDKLNKTLAEISRLSAAKKENDSLKNDLNFKKAHTFDLVGANIIFFDPNNIRETITIDAGTKDGIKKGDVVVAQGFLVGKITETTERTAKIILLTDPDSAIPAMIMDKDISGIVHGKIGSGLRLDQIPQNEKVKKGDLVATSGLGGQFPKGLLMGKVENVQQISGSIFQAIEVHPMVDLNKLERVMVIKG